MAIKLILLPGFATESESLITVGTVVATALVMGVGGALYAALVGTVLVERQALSRAVALLRGRWLATSVRMLIFGLLYGAYSQLVEWLTTQAVAVFGPGLPALLVLAVAMVPVTVFQVVVVVITYAELRGRADGTDTGGLAAGLGGPASSGLARTAALDATSSGGPMGTVIIAKRRRRGFRWGTPVLVLAVLLGAGDPWWPGGGPSVVAVFPVAAVSPVPMGPEDGAGGGGSGGGSGGDSGGSDAGSSPPSVSGSSGSSSDSGSNSGGGDAPKVESRSSPDSGAGGDKGGDSGAASPPPASAQARSQPESGAGEGANRDPVVADPGRSENAQQGSGTQQGGGAGSAALAPGAGQPRDQTGSTTAGADPTKNPQSVNQVGVGPGTPPGAVPQNPGVAAGPRVPGSPEQPSSSASAPPARVELPPGAVLAAPGSQPAPGTQRVMFDGQPVDIPPDMLDYRNINSGASNVLTDSGRQQVVGSCLEGSVSCRAHATDGTDRSFAFERETPTTSIRNAMTTVALDGLAHRLDHTVSATPTAAERGQVRADNAAIEALNAQKAAAVSHLAAYAVPAVRPLLLARTGAEALVPSRPFFTPPAQPKNIAPAWGPRGEAPQGPVLAGRAAGTVEETGQVKTLPRPDGPANPPGGGDIGPPIRPQEPEKPGQPDVYDPFHPTHRYNDDGSIDRWNKDTGQYDRIFRPGAGAPPPAGSPPTLAPGFQPKDATPAIPGASAVPGTTGVPVPPPLGSVPGPSSISGPTSVPSATGPGPIAGDVPWNAANGPGPLPPDVQATFRSGSYIQRRLPTDVTLYRVYSPGLGQFGRYWSDTPPGGPMQVQMDSALNPAWGNQATQVTKIRVPAGTEVFVGAAAPQSIHGGAGTLMGGGSQVYIPSVDPNWLVP